MAASEFELKRTMQQYGKNTLSDDQQIHLLYWVLEDAKNKLYQSKLNQENSIKQLIIDYQYKLKDQKDLQEAIRIVNEFIIKLEEQDNKETTINYLKQCGLYRMLYRNSKVKGEELPQNDVLHKLLRNGFIGVAVSSVAILFFLATVFFAAPFWLAAIATGLFVGAFAYLSGILYGVVNDLFATQANLPYFLLGHQQQQLSLLQTNNKVAQGIAWGVAATFGPVVIAAIVFAVAATITAFFVPLATFLLPVMMIGMALIPIGAEIYARKKAKQYVAEDFYYLNYIGSNEYQKIGLAFMSPTAQEQAAWLANSDRNMFGFTKVPIIGVVGLVALIVLSAVSIFLPPLLFVAPLIAALIPAAFAAVACLTLAISGVYMYINRDKQVDDRYRLEFERDQIEPGLYIQEDMDYLKTLDKKYLKRDPKVTESAPANQEHFDSMFDTALPRNSNGLKSEPLADQLLVN